MGNSAPQSREHMRELGLVGARSRKIAAVERRIKDLVDSAPPLSAEQRDRLALLLQGGGANDAA